MFSLRLTIAFLIRDSLFETSPSTLAVASKQLFSTRSRHSTHAQLSIWPKIQGTPCSFLGFLLYTVFLSLGPSFSTNPLISFSSGLCSTQRDHCSVWTSSASVGFSKFLDRKQKLILSIPYMFPSFQCSQPQFSSKQLFHTHFSILQPL